MDFRDILDRSTFLTGPTSVGKTAVGLSLARRLGAEVVAMDSMTVYRGMDVGTAKPSAAERAEVPHHLLDVIEPWESASVFLYREWAVEAARGVVGRGRRVLFVGGTALYMKALLRGLFEGPPAVEAIRAELEALPSAELHRRLAEVDPPMAARLHPNDRTRAVRAIEVYELTGRSLSSMQREHAEASTHPRVFALARPRGEMVERVDARVGAMMAAGLVDEVRGLLDAPRPIGPVASKGVGYRQVIEHLRGVRDLASTTDLIRLRTRQFAKRQMTWFRNLAEVRLVPVGSGESADGVAGRLAAEIAGD